MTLITVSIGTSTASEEQATPGWIAEQLRRQRADGTSVCVQVVIQTDEVRLTLISRECPSAGVAVPERSERERHIIEIWRRHVYNQPEIAPGELAAFLQRLSREL
jgi:hypothetical protein